MLQMQSAGRTYDVEELLRPGFKESQVPTISAPTMSFPEAEAFHEFS
jgi:hypothetical protein